MTVHPASPRRRAFLRTALWAVALMLVGCSAPTPASVAEPSAPPPVAAAPTVSPAPSVTPLPEGVPPVRVAIPRIGLDQPLIDLGLTNDGGMQVPTDFGAVGWFAPGGRPGGHGPLVIAGHVDSPTGSAVFMRLRELAAGDTVDIADANGGLHTYRVVEVADYSKSAFPTVRVFGAVVADELRLIACGGEFDASVGSYRDNRVVFAVRA